MAPRTVARRLHGGPPRPGDDTTPGRCAMKAIVVTDQAAGTAGMKLVERPGPQGAALASLSGANYGDVVVQVHASGFTVDELSWPSTWIDRLGRERHILSSLSPSVHPALP